MVSKCRVSVQSYNVSSIVRVLNFRLQGSLQFLGFRWSVQLSVAGVTLYRLAAVAMLIFLFLSVSDFSEVSTHSDLDGDHGRDIAKCYCMQQNGDNLTFAINKNSNMNCSDIPPSNAFAIDGFDQAVFKLCPPTGECTVLVHALVILFCHAC